MSAAATNPHWVGGLPAWDITLSSGEVHKGVTRKQIADALRELSQREMCSYYDAILSGDVVRQFHIDLYDRWHASVFTKQPAFDDSLPFMGEK